MEQAERLIHKVRILKQKRFRIKTGIREGLCPSGRMAAAHGLYARGIANGHFKTSLQAGQVQRRKPCL